MTPPDESAPEEADRLILAAWDVLERTGFEGFKVASVIRAAGSSTKAFYRHFESKNRMLLALLLDETKRAGVRITARVAAARSPAEAVNIWIATMVGAAGRADLAARARLFASLSQISSEFPAQVALSRDDVLAPLTAAIEAGRSSGDFPMASGDVDAALVQLLAGAALRDLLDGTCRTGVEQAVVETQAFVLRALGFGRSGCPLVSAE